MFKMTKEESIDGSNTEKIIHKFSDVDEKSTVFKINAAFLVFSLIYSFGQLIKLILDLFFDVEMGDSLLVRIIKLIFDTTPLFLIIVIGIGLGTTVFEMIEPGSISKLFEISRHDVIEKLKKIFQKRDGQNKPRKDQMDQKPVNVKKLIVKRVRLAIMLVLLVVLFYMIVLRPFDEESELKYQTYISLIELLELILFVSLVYSSTKEDASVLNVVKYIFVMVLVSVVISLMQYYGFAYFLDVSLVFSLIRADEGTIMNFIGFKSDPFLPIF